MISGSLTALITAILAMFGIQPTPALIGGIFIFVKVVVVMGIFGLGSKWLKKRKAEANAAEASSPPSS